MTDAVSSSERHEPRSSILYENAEQTVFLIDIPDSITQAQCHGTETPRYTLLSAEPLRQPYPSTEPKTQQARERLRRQTAACQLEYHEEIRTDVLDALHEVRRQRAGKEWCLPRAVVIQSGDQETPRHKHASRLPDVEASAVHRNEVQTHQKPCFDRDSAEKPKLQTKLGSRGKVPPLILSGDYDYFQSSADFSHTTVLNPSCESSIMCDHRTGYRIPPLSSFCLADIDGTSSTLFVEQVSRLMCTAAAEPSTLAATPLKPRGFNVIVLDPPWTNRSLRRSRWYPTLESQTSGSAGNPWESVIDTLRPLIADGGFVLIWVTNSPTTKESARAAMRKWQVELVEEWLWVKTTVSGETVTELDGLWRKPYEAVLIGRKLEVRDSRTEVQTTRVGSDGALPSTGKRKLKRRIIFAVPDVHSRKPCLKELVDRLLSPPEPRYPNEWRTLEVFARNLVSGWCSWGNEVLRFNHLDEWVETDSSRSTTQQ